MTINYQKLIDTHILIISANILVNNGNVFNMITHHFVGLLNNVQEFSHDVNSSGLRVVLTLVKRQ